MKAGVVGVGKRGVMWERATGAEKPCYIKQTSGSVSSLWYIYSTTRWRRKMEKESSGKGGIS